jgi:hypothetical protein
VAAVIDNQILCINSGIGKSIKTLDYIQKTKLPIENAKKRTSGDNSIYDLMLS